MTAYAPATHFNQRSTPPCFVKGTMVHTKEGLKPIEKIQVGDYVWSLPEDGQGEPSYKKVIDTFSRDDQPLWMMKIYSNKMKNPLTGKEMPRLRCHDDEGMGSSFCCLIMTAEHPFYYIGTDKAFNRGMVDKAEHKKRFKANCNLPWFMPDTPGWRPVSELVDGDVILGLDGVPVTIGYCGPLFNGYYLPPSEQRQPGLTVVNKNLGISHWGMVVDFTEEQPVFFDLLTSGIEMAKMSDHLSSRDFGIKERLLNYKWDDNIRWKEEAIQKKYKELCDKPATPEQIAKLHQRAAPYIVRQKVYNITVEDNHTYAVSQNGCSVWAHNSCYGEWLKTKQKNFIVGAVKSTAELAKAPWYVRIGLVPAQGISDKTSDAYKAAKKFYGAFRDSAGDIYEIALRFTNVISTATAKQLGRQAAAMGDGLHMMLVNGKRVFSNLLVDIKSSGFGQHSGAMKQYLGFGKRLDEITRDDFLKYKTDLTREELSALNIDAKEIDNLLNGEVIQSNTLSTLLQAGKITDKTKEGIEQLALKNLEFFQESIQSAVRDLKRYSIGIAQNPELNHVFALKGKDEVDLALKFVTSALADSTFHKGLNGKLQWDERISAAERAEIKALGLSEENWFAFDKISFGWIKEIDVNDGFGPTARTILEESSLYSTKGDRLNSVPLGISFVWIARQNN